MFDDFCNVCMIYELEMQIHSLIYQLHGMERLCKPIASISHNHSITITNIILTYLLTYYPV